MPEGEIWTDTDALVQLVDEVVRNYRVDNKRVYVTGHSMGARGALYLAYKYPERFAAVVAMSPLSPITAWAKQLRSVPLWIIHGAKDTAAPIADSEELVHAIEAAGCARGLRGWQIATISFLMFTIRTKCSTGCWSIRGKGKVAYSSRFGEAPKGNTRGACAP